MKLTELLLQYLHWPAVVCCVVWLLRSQVGTLLGRISKVDNIEYLVANLLISKGQDGNIYSITIAGKEFLKWMTEMSVTEERIG